MLVTQQPVLRRFWYPVAPAGNLTDKPFPFTLLGENIVLWRDAHGRGAMHPRPLLPPLGQAFERLGAGWAHRLRLSRLGI